MIELHRDGEHHVAGPGHIGQNEDGSLTFAIHVDNAGIQALMNEINRPRQAGALVPAEDHMQFTARTYSGPVWVSSVPGVGFNMGLGVGGVAQGLLYEITTASQLPGEQAKDYATLVIRERLDFPETDFTETQIVREGVTKTVNRSRDYAQFTAGEELFVLLRKEGATELHCTFEKGGIERFRHVRIQEAVQFALGQLVQPCVIDVCTGAINQKTFRSVRVREGRQLRQNPPLSFRGSVWRPEVYQIASAYYSKILPHQDERWHELSAHLYYLIEAGGAPIELQCLGISVAAEGIVDTCFPELAQVEQAFRDEVTNAQAKLADLGLSEALKKRIDGALGAMKSARGSDRLRAFVQTKGHDQQLFESWKRLRNTAAHGGKIEGQKIVQTLADLNNLLFLCYSMVLRFCDYTGAQTNYSAAGYPDFTPPAPAPPAPAPEAAAPPVPAPEAPTPQQLAQN